MFKFTDGEQAVVASIEENYRKQFNRLMFQYYKKHSADSLSDYKVQAWLFEIHNTRTICDSWLDRMTRSPDFADHLGGGALSAMVSVGGSFLDTIIEGALSILPAVIRSRFLGNGTVSQVIGGAAMDAFSSALGPFVTRLLHDAFCRGFHGKPDEAEKLFNEAISQQGSLTTLIRQECEGISVELVKLFRFREMLLLGSKDKLSLNFNARQSFIRNAGIEKENKHNIDAVIEYYFVKELYNIFNHGFQKLYEIQDKEIQDEKESSVLHWLNQYFDSKAQRQAFTHQIQMEFMQMTRDFLLLKMNQPSFLARHPWLIATASGLLVSLLVSSIIMLSVGFSAIIIGPVAMLSFGLGFLASYMASTRLEFFKYQRGKDNRHCIQDAIDSIHHEYLRLNNEITTMAQSQHTWVQRSERFARLADCYFFCTDKKWIARGAVSSWLREYAAHYRHSKEMAIDLVNVYEKIVTQSREQNELIVHHLKKQHFKELQSWIDKSKAYILDSANKEDIVEFELIEKFREEVLDLVMHLRYQPIQLLEFYSTPLHEGGLGGEAADFARIQRFMQGNFSHLLAVTRSLYKSHEPDFYQKPYFQGASSFRTILGLNPGHGMEGLNKKNVDQWLNHTHAFLLSMCKRINPGHGLNVISQSAIVSDEYLLYRMLVLRQFAETCRGIDQHPDQEVILKIEEFVRWFFHAEPDVIFDDFINSDFLLNPNQISSDYITDQDQQQYSLVELSHLNNVFKMSLAYVSQAFSPMRALRYYADKYPEEQRHLIALENDKDILNPQNTSDYLQRVRQYCRDTRIFLLREQNNEALKPTNIHACYRFQLSQTVVQIIMRIVLDIANLEQQHSSEHQSNADHLLKSLQSLMAFINDSCCLPQRGTPLETIMQSIRVIATQHHMSRLEFTKLVDAKDFVRVLKDIPAYLQTTRSLQNNSNLMQHDSEETMAVGFS